jgi:hypothetical protein
MWIYLQNVEGSKIIDNLQLTIILKFLCCARVQTLIVICIFASFGIYEIFIAPINIFKLTMRSIRDIILLNKGQITGGFLSLLIQNQILFNLTI